MLNTIIEAKRLNRDAYQAYGEIIKADDSTLPFSQANMGTAQRFNRLAPVDNLRPSTATLNLCVFRCNALTQRALNIKLLEKHPLSTQVFLPMSKEARYLVIVSLGDQTPDLSTLAAFIAQGPEGISYRPGVWHYPMTCLDQSTDFACLVWEDGSRDDCCIHQLEQPITIQFSAEPASL